MPFQEPVNRFIEAVSSSGLRQKLVLDILDFSRRKKKLGHAGLRVRSKMAALKLSQLYVVLLIWVVGNAVAAVAFVSEMTTVRGESK